MNSNMVRKVCAALLCGDAGGDVVSASLYIPVFHG